MGSIVYSVYYTYVLKSASKPKYYIGWSADLHGRLRVHNNGSVASTKHARPWKVLYYEAYATENLAREREQLLKQRGKAWQALKRRVDP